MADGTAIASKNARRTSIASKREPAQTAERVAQTSIVRDLLGNPFRTVSIDPACLSWNQGTIQKIAQTIYHERQYDNLSVLSDALNQAAMHEPRYSDSLSAAGTTLPRLLGH